MAAIFTGLGAGLGRGSASVLGGSGLLGSAATGRGGDNVMVNAATGNLIISRQDEFLAGVGPDVSVARTYNSLAVLPDDNNDKWRQSNDRRIYGLTGTVNTAGSTVKRVTGDGTEITYTWDAAYSAYITKDGGGTYDSIVKYGAEWIWCDGSAETIERYDYALGRLTAIQLITGQGTSYSYDAQGRMDKATTNDGSWVRYDWIGTTNNLQQLVTGYTDLQTSTARTLTRTRYTYDGSNRLQTVTVDLSPDDSSITDGAVYVTTYSYDSANRVSNIAQTDGSNLAIAYDASGRVSTLTQTVSTGVTRVTQLNYYSGYTTVTDPSNQVTRLDYDAAGNLTKVTSPPASPGATQQVVQFAYNANGDLTSTTDARGETTTFSNFTAHGEAQTIQDRNGNTITRVYGSITRSGSAAVSTTLNLNQINGGNANVLLSETRQGVDQTGATVSETTRYVYNTAGEVQYVISPEGRVSEYQRYLSNVTAEIIYPDATYTAAGNPSLGEMNTWRDALDRAGIEKVSYAYDARGNLSSTTSYIVHTATGGNDASQSFSQQAFVRDQAGQLLKSYYYANFDEVDYVYDGLGRVVASSDLGKGVTTVYFDDANSRTVMHMASGLTRTLTYNKAGDLISEVESATGQLSAPQATDQTTWTNTNVTRTADTAIGGQPAYKYALTAGGYGTVSTAAGSVQSGQTVRLRLTLKGVGGNVSHSLGIAGNTTGWGSSTSDKAAVILKGPGRIVLGADGLWQIDGLSTTVETVIEISRTFSQSETVTAYFYLGNPSSSLAAGTSVILAAPSVVTTEVNAGLSLSATTQYAYDKLGRVRVTTDALGFKSYTVYDGAGRHIGDVDNSGYLTEYQYDANNRLIGTVNWHNAIDAADLTALANPDNTLTILDLRPAAHAQDTASWTLYDDEGRIVQDIDGAGRITVYTYDAAGQLLQKRRHVTTVSVTGFKTAPPTVALTPSANANDEIVRNFYDKEGLLIGSLNAEGYLTKNSYDFGGRLVAVTQLATVAPVGQRATGSFNTLLASVGASAQDRTTRYVYDGRGVLRYVIDPLNQVTTRATWRNPGELARTYVYAAPMPATADYSFDNMLVLLADLEASSAKRATYYTYDAGGRLAYSIDALGGVTGYRYDNSGNLVRVVEYAATNAVVGQPSTDGLDTWSAARINDAGNRITRTWYDARGLAAYSVDAEGFLTRNVYDARGQLLNTIAYDTKVTVTDSTTLVAVGALATGTYTVTGAWAYDALGRVTREYSGAANTAPTDYTSYTYHGATSLVNTVTRAANGTVQEQAVEQLVYDGSGALAARTLADGSTITTTLDGRGNLQSVNQAGQVTAYTYDLDGRVKTVTDAAGGITTYEYNGFGQAWKVTDARGNSTYTWYDTLGRVSMVRDAEGYLTRTEYTIFGEIDRVKRWDTPVTGTPSMTTEPTPLGTAAITSFTYNKMGQVTQKIDAEGYVETSTYDRFGQLATLRRYELSAYGTFGGRTGAIQEAFAQAILLRQQADSLGAAAAAADTDLAAALTAKNNAQTVYNSALTTANASTAAITPLQQNVSSLQSQISARPEHAVIQNPVVPLQAYVNGLNAAVANANASASQLPPEQQYGYYVSVVYPLEQQAAAAASVLASVQAGNPLPASSYSMVLTAAGYNSTQISSYTTLVQNLAAAQASLSTAQTVAATDAATLATAQTALNQATANHTQAVNAAAAAHSAADTADASADAAFSSAQQLSTMTSSTLPAFTIADLEDAAVTTFEYDRRGNVTKSIDAQGFYETYTYDAQGQLKTTVGKSFTTTTAAGGTTTYSYDACGRLISETLPIQSYDSAGNALGAITNSYSYDKHGNLVSKTEAQGLPEQRVTTYTYDKLNRLTTTVGQAVSGVSIDAASKAVSTVSGSPTQTNTYDLHGNLTKTVDAAGAVTVFFYDALNRKSVEINAQGTYTSYTYDANSNVTNVKVYETTVSVPTNGGSANAAPTAPAGPKRETTFQYNGLNQMVSSTVLLPSDYKTGTWSGSTWTNLTTTAFTTNYTYDYLGNVVKVTDPNGNASFSYFDLLGRKVAQVDGQGYLTEWAYNADANVLSERRYATRYTGNPTVETSPYILYDASDRITNYTYDFNGNRLTESRTGVVVHNGSGGSNTVTSTISYLYNGLGEVTRKTEATGDQFNYTYDAGGRLTRETRPTFTSNSGNVTPQADYFYDGLGNLMRNVQAGGGDASARVTTYNYGAGGRLASMTDAENGVRNYLYDVAGRLVLEHYSRTVTATSGTTSTVYEGIGYRYDSLGRSLGQGFYAKPASTWQFQAGNDYSMLEYNAFGDVVRTGANGAWQQENKYDLAGRLWATNSGDGIWKYFGYDRNGNQTLAISGAGENMAGLTLATAFAKAAQANVNASYTVYDKRNLATSVVEEGRELTSSGNSTLTTSRAYNAFGEVITETNAAGFSVSYTYNTMGRTIRSESPTVANTLENGTTHYVKPSQDFYYDASGRLVASRDANGTYATGGISTNGTSKAANTGNLTRLTLLAGTGYGGSEALVTLETHADTGVKETKYDIHGNARVVIDEEGRTLVTQTYDKLGRMVTAARLGGLTDNYTWDILGQQVTHWNSLYTSSNKEISVFDIQGRITSSRAFGGDVTSTTFTWSAGLEAAGTGLVDTGGWMQVTTFANTRALTEKSDLFGRAIEKTDLGGHVTTYNYDLAGRLTSSAIGTTSYNYEYYNTGQVKKAYTIAPNWTYYTSTATAATSNTFSTTTTQNATYTYDAVGNRLTEYGTLVNGATTVVWKNHTATYDALGRLLTDTMASTTVQPTASVAFQYDANGNIRSKTSTYRQINASGGVGTSTATSAAWYRYDNMNRVVLNNGVLQNGAIVTSAPVSVNFIGDPSQTITYNKAGQRVSVWTNKYFTFGPYSGNTPYGPISNVTLNYFGPVREDYTYDAAGRLYQVRSAESFLDFNGYLAAYNPSNPPSLQSFVGIPATGTLRTQFTYDAMGRQTSQNGYASNGTSVIYNTTTTYNAKGQVSNTFASTLKADGKTYTQTVTNQFGTVGTTGYALGAVTSFTSSNTVTGQTTKTASTTNTFQWWDSALQNTISYDSDTGSTSNPVYTTTFTYNGLGQLTKSQINDGLPRTVTFSLDEMGQIIRRDETNVSGQTGAPHEFWYRLGDREIGYTGNNSGEDPTMLGSLGTLQDVSGNGTFRGGATTSTPNVGFAQALESFNSHSQGSQAGGYTVQAGDTLQAIAKRLYGDEALWYKIAEVNGLSAGGSLIQGQQLTLPAGVTRNTYTNESFRPYDPAQAIGDLSPTTPKPNKAKCGLFGQILLAAIAIGVAVLLPAVGALSSTMFGGGILGGAVAGAIGAAAGSVVSQGVGLATGIQEKFSFKGVALAALSGAVQGGIAGWGKVGEAGIKAASEAGKAASTLDKVGAFLSQANPLSDFVRGVATNSATQGIAKLTGLQDKFSWVGVATAGVGAAVGGAVGRGLTSNNGLFGIRTSSPFVANLASSTAYGIASAATRSAITGESFADGIMAVLPDVIGQAIGNLVAEKVTGASSKAEARAHYREIMASPEGQAFLQQAGYDPSHPPKPSDLLKYLGDVSGPANGETIGKISGRISDWLQSQYSNALGVPNATYGSAALHVNTAIQLIYSALGTEIPNFQWTALGGVVAKQVRGEIQKLANIASGADSTAVRAFGPVASALGMTVGAAANHMIGKLISGQITVATDVGSYALAYQKYGAETVARIAPDDDIRTAFQLQAQADRLGGGKGAILGRDAAFIIGQFEQQRLQPMWEDRVLKFAAQAMQSIGMLDTDIHSPLGDIKTPKGLTGGPWDPDYRVGIAHNGFNFMYKNVFKPSPHSTYGQNVMQRFFGDVWQQNQPRWAPTPGNET